MWWVNFHQFPPQLVKIEGSKFLNPWMSKEAHFWTSICHAEEFISPLDILGRWCQNWTYEQTYKVDHMSQPKHTHICKLYYKKIYVRITDSHSNTTHTNHITVLMYDFISIFLLGCAKHGDNTIKTNIIFWYLHNITPTHSSVMWDWQYPTEHSLHSGWMWGILCILLLVPQNTTMDLNNVMFVKSITYSM